MSTRSQRRVRTRALAIGAIVALVALFGATAPAYAAPPAAPPAKYVALGDSYAAGQGAGAPLDGCLRTAAAYPVLLDAEPRTNLLRNAACSGATIADVAATQLSQVNRGTTLVTLTVGANDLGVGAVYAACEGKPLTDPGCAAALAAATAVLRSFSIERDLQALIVAIAERAPNAHIVVTNYPVPFVYGLTGPGGITDQVNEAIFNLDHQIPHAVQSAALLNGVDVELVEMAGAFFGHQIGSGASYLGEESFNPYTFLHPTAEGQALYRDAIVAALAS